MAKDEEEKVNNEDGSIDILIEQMSDVALLLEAKIKQDHDLDNSKQLDIMIEQFSKLEKTLTIYLKQEKDEKEEEESDLLKSIQKVGETLQALLEESKKKEEYSYEIEITDSLREKLRGKPGDDGKTPKKGVDYFTKEEIEDMSRVISSALGVSNKRLIEETVAESFSGYDLFARLAELEKEKKISFSDLIDDSTFQKQIDAINKHFDRLGHGGGSGSFFGLTDVDSAKMEEGITYSFKKVGSTIVPIVASSGGGTPATTVVDETAFGQTPDVGTATEYAREDHTHGTPTDPVPAHVALPDPHTQYQKESEKGAVNGYAELDGAGKVPAAQLPSYVDDILEYANLAAFPVTGATGIIYVALDTNKIYRWTGTVYVEVSTGVTYDDGGISFAFFRSSGLVIGDGFKMIIPFSGTITDWIIATKDGTSGTITLDTKKAAYAGVPTFSAIDGGGANRVALSAASKNQGLATGWTVAVTAGDHIEITVNSVTGVLTGIYGIIKVTKTS